MKDLVSIIVPVYNASQYLEKCINSLLNQTYQSVEIVLVNDGSTDNSEEIILKKAACNPNVIKLINKKNGGVSSARNEGLKKAKGEYIAFVDSDDWVEPNMIEVLVNNIKRANSELSVCAMIDEYNGVETIPLKRDCCKVVDKKKALELLVCEKSFYGYACNKLFKKNKLKDQMFDESLLLCEDMDFCLEYILKCNTVCYTLDELYHYRHHTNSTTGELNYSTKNLSILKVYEKLIQVYKKEKPDLYHIVLSNYLKVAINIKGRMEVSGITDLKIEEYLNGIIKNNYKMIMCNDDVSKKTKINIALSKIFPGVMLRLKQKILSISRTFR